MREINLPPSQTSLPQVSRDSMRGRPAEEREDEAETPLPQRGAANRRDRGPFASAGSVRSPLVEGRLLTPSQVSMEGREEVGDPVLTPPPSTRAGDAQRAPAARQLGLLLTKARGLPERWGGTERCQLCPGSAGHLSSPRGRQSRARGPSAAVRVSANHTSKLRGHLGLHGLDDDLQGSRWACLPFWVMATEWPCLLLVQ